MFDSSIVANFFGILSLITAIAIIYPSSVNILKRDFKHQKFILKVAQWGLFSTVTLSLIHGLLATQKANIDFYDLSTYWIYAGGLFLFNLVAFLAFTFPQIKSDCSKLNYFNYAVLLLLVLHLGHIIIP